MWILKDQTDDAFTFRVAPGGVKTFGRATRADFILDVALVSRLHCRVEATPDSLDITDLGSTNGTFVNDQRVERASLVVGDKLRIGRVELTVSRM